MFTAQVTESPVCIAHKLDLPYDSKCNKLHGHNYTVRVDIEAQHVDTNGMVVDFTHVKEVIKRYDHTCLGSNLVGHGVCHTEVTPSTAEMFAYRLWFAIEKMLLLKARADSTELGIEVQGAQAVAVHVWETPNNVITFRPEDADFQSVRHEISA